MIVDDVNIIWKHIVVRENYKSLKGSYNVRCRLYDWKCVYKLNNAWFIFLCVNKEYISVF